MPNVDERPPVWVGHLALNVSDLERSSAFWDAVGMRTVHCDDQMTIFELRGGTHLLLFEGDPAPGGASFDLMVDDIDATHATWTERGLNVSEIERGQIHDGFNLTDPDGYVVSVCNSHVVGPV
jgi:catechol 2,3-dioxygenase-like lactoylglutathione lyase family enzyme